MGNASASKHDNSPWADQNPVSARTAALMEAWRSFSKDTTGNAHDQMYRAMVHGWDSRNTEERS